MRGSMPNIHIISLNPYRNGMKWGLLSSHYRRRNRGLEKLYNFFYSCTASQWLNVDLNLDLANPGVLSAIVVYTTF